MTIPSTPFDPSAWLQAWQQGLAQSHLQFGAVMRQALEAAPLDARGKAQMDFALRQVIDAMNPANSFATNPEAMQAALDSGGTKAQGIDGSWWPAWSEWLGAHAGAKVAARRVPGSAGFPAIEPAPGRYVKAKAA